MLSPRQELLLGKVVDGFAATGQPVGSKALAADPEVEHGPSTIRNELAVLEELGLLAHPHTSAGRVPTDSGYRYFVDHVLPQRASKAVEPRALGADAGAPRGRRGHAGDHRDALPGHEPAGDRHRAADRDDDDPPRRGARPAAAGADGGDHHVDRWGVEAGLRVRQAGRSGPGGMGGRLPQRAAGGGWASVRACCTSGRGTRRCRPTERALPRLSSRRPSPSWPRRPRTRCTSTVPRGCCPSTASRTSTQLNAVMEMLERRVTLLERALRRARPSVTSTCASGQENAAPALHGLSLVAANYGLPRRNLGRCR